jgi:hypothetical protein
MQCCRAGFLRTGQNEIEPLDFSGLGPPHRHESRTADRIAQLISVQVTKAGALTLPIFFVTSRFGSMSYIAMAAALKVFARGTLTFVEIIIVVLFVASLAAMAAIGCLGPRKRNRASEIPGVLFDRFNRGPRHGLIAR